MPKELNYTEEQTQHMIESYTANPTRETVDALAEELGKTVKSIIGKLSREKVYVKKEYITKRGEKPITKLQMLSDLAEVLDGDVDEIVGLQKASKQDLTRLTQLINEKINPSS